MSVYSCPVFSQIELGTDHKVVPFDQALPDNDSWIKDIHKEHPRIFINKDMLPKVREWAKKIGYKYLLLNADSFEYDPKLIRKRWNRGYVKHGKSWKPVNVKAPADWGDEAVTEALAYILTGEKKYAEKCWTFLQGCLHTYRECSKNRTTISWYGARRIEALTAYDWIYDTLTPEQRKKFITEFIEVNKPYMYATWDDAKTIGALNASDYQGGFYGDKAVIWFAGLAAYNDGFCDKEAVKLLKDGYGKYRKMLAYRDKIAGDDGMLSSSTVGYSCGQYPWASYFFLLSWKAAVKGGKIPDCSHLAIFPIWYQWNALPSEDKSQPRCFGIGDDWRTNIKLPGATKHLYNIMSLYRDSHPEEAALAAKYLCDSSGKKQIDASCFNSDKYYYMRGGKKAHIYNWWLFNEYLLYNMGEPLKPLSDEEMKKRSARHFANGGILIMRSGSGPNDTYALFNIGCKAIYHKGRGDENHFIIFKKGYLAIDSGTRLSDGSPHGVKYNQSSLAHNTMLIHMPDEKFPQDRKILERFLPRWQRENKDNPAFLNELEKQKKYFEDAYGGQNKRLGGKCLAFSTNSNYTYIAGDAAPVYDKRKCAGFTRQFVYVMPDYFIIFDRVTAVKPEYRKDWLLHFLNEPTVSGKTVSADSGEGGRIILQSILPEDGVIKKIGGPGKEFLAGEVNWDVLPNIKKKYPKNYFGKWRIEITPGKAAQKDIFLNFIQVGESDKLKSPVAVKSITDKSTVGLSFTTLEGKTITVLFNTTGKVGGHIKINDSHGKELLDENLSQKVQNQAGF
jgi:heparin/heparan-sulfate lyase